MTAGRQNIWHEVRVVGIFALLYCTLNGAISQGEHNKRSRIKKIRHLQYIQTKSNETDFAKTVKNSTGASLNAKFFVIQIVIFSDLML